MKNNKTVRKSSTQTNEPPPLESFKLEQNDFQKPPAWYVEETRNARKVSLEKVMLVGPALDS